METVLIVIAIAIAAPIVLGPFMIKASQWVASNFSINTVPAESLDEEVRLFLDKAKAEFESIGFEFIGDMSLSDYMPNMTTFFALFIDGQSKRSAMAAVIKHGSGRIVAYYEFTAKYSNGRVINVSNSPTMGSFRNPDKSSYRYPKIRSARELNDIHRWITGHDRRAAGDPVVYDKGRATEMLAEALKNELRLQEKFGYFSLSGEKGRFLFTWKGAFIMTERNVFPIKNILVSLDLAAAKKAIAGMPPDSQDAAGNRGGTAGKEPAPDAGLKDEQRFKHGASWFYWIAALTLVNSLAMKLGVRWEFVLGLGATRLVDIIAMMEQYRTGGIMLFQASILVLDVGFAALFAAFGLAARKGSADSYEVGLVFYGLDSFLLLLTFDVMGIILHGIALFFLFRGWRALKRLQASRPQPARVPV